MKRMTAGICTLMGILALGSCSLIGSDDDIVTGEDASPIVLTRAESRMTSEINTFGIDVFGKLVTSTPRKQIFISPLSLSLALAMTSNGAVGDTQKQMREVLGFKEYDEAGMNEYFRKMTGTLATIDKSTTFETANSVWVEKSIEVKGPFVSDVEKFYDAKACSRDFNLSSTLKEINSWCSDHTHGKITSILDRLDDSYRMLLMNALYFKGIWRNKFKTVEKGEFTDIDGKKNNVQMMSATRACNYAEADNWQAVELPYGNGAFSMVVVLPSKTSSVSSLIGTISGEGWDKLVQSMYSCEVNLSIPEFKLEYETELQDILSDMGMTLAMSPDADFSNLSTTPLYISLVKQKTFVDVNKEGTEAAAVTVVGMKCTSAGPSQTKYFKADHPFIFAIRENSTGTILFIGQKCL